MRIRWEEFLCRKFPLATEDCLCDLYDELIEWDGEVGESIRLLLQGRRINLAKLRGEQTIRSMIDDRKRHISSEELHSLEDYYCALLELLDDSMRLACRH